jgi:Domain of unknown function (DUF4249)
MNHLKTFFDHFLSLAVGGFFARLAPLALLLPLGACEDVVNLDLAEGRPQLVVDGFIDNRAQSQTIRLTLTSAYFRNAPSPPVAGAQVRVTNRTTGRQFTFTDRGQGNYVWQPVTAETLGVVGDDFALSVRYQNEEFTASSRLARTATVDSITYELKQDELGQEDGYYAQAWATDPVGQRDFFWLRAYKNGRYLDKPGLINYVVDGIRNYNPAFQTSDGFPFIPPVRERITDPEAPYQPGDSVRVELLSINQDTFEFLRQTEAQMTNSGLFARPPENVRTNVLSPNGSNAALGWFCVGSVQARGLRIRELAPGARGKG